jgi:hypothetical protein
MNLRRSVVARSKTALSRERLRRRYRPARVRLLFVGEAPPASGRFFYQADSGLYRAVRDAFARVFPKVDESDFLASFRGLGCYLVDLCGRPVDHLSRKERKMACLGGEARLARTLKQLSPKIAITVVRSVGVNVKRSEARANWHGQHIELPYPGRWQRHRARFLRELTVVLRDSFRRPPPVRSQ